MASKRRRLKGLARALGFFSGAALLGAFVCAGTASAQCGPTGPTSAKNTACGTGALISNTTGVSNSAFGYNALDFNTTGFHNTASGAGTLHHNTTGFYDTASGAFALFSNATGGYNTASGANALYRNTTGRFNTASGSGALYFNTTGDDNTASGTFALYSNTTGHDNIGLGFDAGDNIRTGSNNIDIGGAGTHDESNTIRIGYQGTQTTTYIAGISGSPVSSTNVVCVSSGGRLGVCTSSARYKRDIRDMGAASSGVMKLRPVVFRYRSDAKSQPEYGLIAEEVARVYPELVDYGHDGKPLTVRYLELNAMLLNELQKKDRQLATQQREIDGLSELFAALEQQVQTVNPEEFRALARK